MNQCVAAEEPVQAETMQDVSRPDVETRPSRKRTEEVAVQAEDDVIAVFHFRTSDERIERRGKVFYRNADGRIVLLLPKQTFARGGASVALVRVGHELRVGVAICSDRDNFCPASSTGHKECPECGTQISETSARRNGRKIAIGRARKNPYSRFDFDTLRVGRVGYFDLMRRAYRLAILHNEEVKERNSEKGCHLGFFPVVPQGKTQEAFEALTDYREADYG